MKKTYTSPFRIILLGYITIILLGGTLLCFPFSSRSGEWTSFIDSVFTSTSATCVTGLIRFDTYQHWSLIGQIIILLLIQVGGIGFMSLAMMFFSVTRKNISISGRMLMKESVSAPQIGGAYKITRIIITGTALFEGLGAILLCFHYCPQLGFVKGLYFSVFHSISAFCNAGFDVMGGIDGVEPMSSLISIQNNAYVSIVLMFLIVIGGLGFFVWSDIIEHKHHVTHYRVHSKLVLVISAILIVFGAGLCFLFDTTVGHEPVSGSTVLHSFFSSISARTAGFTSVDLGKICQPTQLVLICLMLIGGSPGSTAGGMKTTTFGVVALTILSTIRRKKSVETMGRRISDEVVRNAACIMLLYILVMVSSAMAISAIDNVPILSAMFETASATATVGSTVGLTPTLSVASEIIVTLLMLFGRVGGITMLLAISSDKKTIAKKLPVENVQVG